jgi:rfaE bifunctional protein nucleotidyltransferase chain/domain
MRSREQVRDKIISLAQIARESQRLREAGKRIVATNGCFDILHVGHVRYLAAARQLGDALIVGLNGDQSVRELKGEGRPLNNELDRAEILAALESIDYVVIFPQVRATKFLIAAQPAVYVKGGDYKPETLDPDELEILDKLEARIELIPFERGYSTSALIKKLDRCAS